MARRESLTVYYDPQELEVKETVRLLSRIEGSPYYKRTVSRICEMLLVERLTKLVRKYETEIQSLTDE